MASKRDLLSMLDLETDLVATLELAASLKNRTKAGEPYEPLRGKSLAMIFEKASTRTRVSFEVGMTQLGGHALFLSPNDLQVGRGETIADTARVLSRFVDGILYRAFKSENVRELARHATVPVINGLDDKEHPCQIVADLMTIHEQRGELKGLKLAYVGDGNNVCNSLLIGCAEVGMHMTAGVPKGYEPDPGLLAAARRIAAGKEARIEVVHDPFAAVRDADVLYTDVWVSMGMEKEREERERIFLPYQVNAKLVAAAKPDAMVMHCLPAHRGLEITDDVVDGKQSIVFDQAENRLHAQKAILVRFLGGE
ncbi:MAG TPA: ornithine carbamoyltransferase [Thermoplasmata archaeon]|nr:ornithine carbamoyltransferase [Thermoplasmata archaeon]